MANKFPNIELLVGQLTADSLAHRLCLCFKDDAAEEVIRSKLQMVLDTTREEIESVQAGGKGS